MSTLLGVSIALFAVMFLLWRTPPCWDWKCQAQWGSVLLSCQFKGIYTPCQWIIIQLNAACCLVGCYLILMVLANIASLFFASKVSSKSSSMVFCGREASEPPLVGVCFVVWHYRNEEWTRSLLKIDSYVCITLWLWRRGCNYSAKDQNHEKMLQNLWDLEWDLFCWCRLYMCMLLMIVLQHIITGVPSCHVRRVWNLDNTDSERCCSVWDWPHCTALVTPRRFKQIPPGTGVTITGQQREIQWKKVLMVPKTWEEMRERRLWRVIVAVGDGVRHQWHEAEAEEWRGAPGRGGMRFELRDVEHGVDFDGRQELQLICDRVDLDDNRVESEEAESMCRRRTCWPQGRTAQGRRSTAMSLSQWGGRVMASLLIRSGEVTVRWGIHSTSAGSEAENSKEHVLGIINGTSSLGLEVGDCYWELKDGVGVGLVL